MVNPDVDPDVGGEIFVRVTQRSRIPVPVERQPYEGPSRIPAQPEPFRTSPRNMVYRHGRHEASRRYQPYILKVPKPKRMTRWWSWEFSKTTNSFVSWGIISCDATQLYRGKTYTKIASGTRVRGFEPGCPNNPQHAFLQRGSKKNLSHVPALRHVKEPGTLVNSGFAS
jgi:hypothetical protein